LHPDTQGRLQKDGKSIQIQLLLQKQVYSLAAKAEQNQNMSFKILDFIFTRPRENENRKSAIGVYEFQLLVYARLLTPKFQSRFILLGS